MTQNPPRILVIDDEPVICAITQSVLDEHDFAVAIAESGSAALALIEREYTPDLVLLDVLMPGINGFDVCRQLRRETRFKHLPIIMLTGLDDQASIDEAYACGATDFITKPVNLPLLPHRVRYLLRSAAAFRDLFDNQVALINTQKIARLGNWRMNSERAIVDASQAFLDILDILDRTELPFSEEQMLARIHREDRETFLARRRQLAAGHEYQIDYRLRNPQLPTQWTHVHERATPVYDGRGVFAGATGYTQDINERVQSEERIRDLAWHDRITGLNNRPRLLELLENGGGSEMTLIFLHVGGLAQWSSVLGQEAADDVVQAIALRLKSLRKGSLNRPGLDTTCLHSARLARYDEDSFVVALGSEARRANPVLLTEAMLAILGHPLTWRGENFTPKIHAGIAYYPEDAADVPELIRRAKLVALQAAGNSGPAISLFDPIHDREASQRLLLEQALRTAIQQGGQLQPYFQPKASLADGRMTGAEVLLRWQHPELGMIPPAQFIPLAEDSGLIHPLSDWLFEHVCSLYAGWIRDGLPIANLSINLSADSFFQPGLLQRFDAIIARTGLATDRLTIELTESVLLQDREIARQLIDALRQRGMRISLDDFGTGFSSLGYLNSFHIDEIKIDRSFIVDLCRDTREIALVQAIISLGHALDIEVVAEGVETLEQADLLREMGCDILQGFIYARPMPAAEFSTFHKVLALGASA